MRENFKFDRAQPCLVIAPHLLYPTRNGGDILIDRRWAEFSRFVPYVDIIGNCTVTRYIDGRMKAQRKFDNSSVSKREATVRTILGRSHYLLEKYLSDEFKTVSLKYLRDQEYSTIVFSLISTASLYESLPKVAGRLYCVETQNDEIKWFENLMASSRNPAAKLAAFFSKRWLKSFLIKYSDAFLYVHVSVADREGYLQLLPHHRSIVAPVGVDIENIKHHWGPDEKVRLVFIGSLSVRMNLDALGVFRDEFWPAMRDSFGDTVEVVVAGSNPSSGVKALCNESGFKLYPDVTNEKLQELFSSATFSILPFHYVTGGKLKLLKSLSYGVPFLSTLEMADQIDKLLFPCLTSNTPMEWVSRVAEVMKDGIGANAREELVEYSRRFSWHKIASGVVASLDSLNERPTDMTGTAAI